MSNLTNNAPQSAFRIGDRIRVLASGELATVKALTGRSVVAVVEGLQDNLMFDPAEVEAAVRALLCSVCGAALGTISAPLPDVPVKCQQCSRADTCASWCTSGDGHPGETLDADRTCWGPDSLIPLTLEPPYYPQAMPAVEVSAHRQWGGRDSVYLAAPNGDVDMTASEARQLAAVLLQVADVVDADAPSASDQATKGIKHG